MKFEQDTIATLSTDSTDEKPTGSVMKELMYFSFADLLIRVEYASDANSLKYATHREVTLGERVIVEQYLLTNLAPKTEFYSRHPALFVYLGSDEKLTKELNLFHLKNSLKFMVGKEKEVKEKVDTLISESMRNYYFEKIGDSILVLKDAMNGAEDTCSVAEELDRIAQLVDAYNLYSDRKIAVDELLPEELHRVAIVSDGHEIGFDSEE